MRRMRVLIVDDEALIRSGIRSALGGLEGIEVAGECGNGTEAVERILAGGVELVLLDVQMPGATGLDVVRLVGAARMPMVVFVTAYDEYAIQAFEMNAVDYLLKPFDRERLRQSVERARERMERQSQSALVERLQALLEVQQPRTWPERMVVKNGERYDFVATADIDRIESANNYVQIHAGEATHLLAETLTSMEGRLDPGQFARVHRCHIVNVSRIVAIYPMLHGTWVLELRNGARITTGRQYRAAVQALIAT